MHQCVQQDGTAKVKYFLTEQFFLLLDAHQHEVLNYKLTRSFKLYTKFIISF